MRHFISCIVLSLGLTANAGAQTSYTLPFSLTNFDPIAILDGLRTLTREGASQMILQQSGMSLNQVSFWVGKTLTALELCGYTPEQLETIAAHSGAFLHSVATRYNVPDTDVYAQIDAGIAAAQNELGTNAPAEACAAMIAGREALLRAIANGPF